MNRSDGSLVLLSNIALGIALVECLYVVGKYAKPRQAKKVASALNDAIRSLNYGDEFSSFRAETLDGKFPIGAMVLNVPLRVATPAAVREWVEDHATRFYTDSVQ